MFLRTKIFDIYGRKYSSITELAKAMDISVSQVYRVREGKRSINQKFIIGVMKAFPEYKFDELFYFAPLPYRTSAILGFTEPSLEVERATARAREIFS